MLLILLGSLLALWAAVLVVIVAACVSAARGDGALLASLQAERPAHGHLRRLA